MANTCSHRGSNHLSRLPLELLADIHGRLGLVDRFCFAAACGAGKSRRPCLILPGATPETKTIFSLSDRCSDTARTPLTDHHPATRGAVVVLGSSGGWLVTADARAQLRIANPITGDQADLPAITTIPFVRWIKRTHSFLVDHEPFLQMHRSSDPILMDGGGGGGPKVRRKQATTASLFSGEHLRSVFYRKVVLSDASPRPAAAMLILDPQFGAPAFAAAEDPVPAWRLAPFRDAVEDAIYHAGRFHSITYSGVVESWDRDAGTGVFTSQTVAPRLASCQDHRHYPRRHRKYLAAAPDGRLMAVVKHSRSCAFTVHVLDEDGRRWEETKDIGDAALFVGVNASVCVPAAEHPELSAGCVYFTNDELGQAYMDWDLLKRYDSVNSGYGVELRDRNVGVFNLRDDKVGKVEGLGMTMHPFWPLPAWFTPSIS